ncbi:hypothetical protein AB0G74_30555 [Streptomyces sp. NPDC020875]|uniref:hypothetical protein n=1 Tax=Streptomyces sp. NPDC020875 TaxID=3154898 RepID=UPI00340DB849
MTKIELPDELIRLEAAAWAEIRDGRLTVESAAAVQTAITEFAQEGGHNRYEVEHALKALARGQDTASA